jgi:hypothetical protein
MGGVRSTALSTVRRSREREDKQPVYLAFAKVGGGWQKIGAAWNFRSGEEGYSLQITALPLNWDGRFILAVPTEEGEPAQRPEE